jgi:phosphatidylglycerol:prolipoprotein diacylglycerol transferase
VRPTLFTLPLGAHGLGLHSYGLAIALGFAVGVVLAVRQAQREGLDSGAMMDLLFWILVSGVLGSRLVFVLIHAGEYARLCAGGGARTWGRALSDCAAPLRIWEGGLVYYGGALAATGMVAWFARRQRWSFRRVADLLAPSLALGHVFGRIGCFFAGCCFGKPWAAGLAFPRGSVAFDDLMSGGQLPAGAASTPPLHPTQLYEAAGELGIFFLLLWFRRRQRFAGATALLYAVSYAGLRFVVEIFRGDTGRGFLVRVATPRLAALLHLPAEPPLFLSTSQVTSVVLGIAAILLWRRYGSGHSKQGT